MDNKWKWKNQWKNIVGAVSIAIVLTLGITVVGKTAISELAGLAVAQTSTLWNSVADAAKGDGLTTGIMAQSSYLFNGVTFDRLRGAPAADGIAGTGLQASVIALFNGTTYDRMRGGLAADASAVTGLINNAQMLFNGATYDRVRGTVVADGVAATGYLGTLGLVYNGATLDRWRGGMSPVEGGSPTGTLFNSQTTGGVTTAVVTTIAASAATRTHVYQVEGRCSAATSSITITDGGTTIWSTGAAEVAAAVNFVRVFATALTGATNSAIVITLAACTAGTGTLIVAADRY